MSFVIPLWHLNIRAVRRRSARIVREAEVRTHDFEQRRRKVQTATERAERAAVQLMQRSDELARIVARGR